MVVTIKILMIICLVCLVPFCIGLCLFGIDMIKAYILPIHKDDNKP